MVENNIIESVKNNIIGTYNVAKCCTKFKVSKALLISTDKAVKPTSIMGATKKISEMIFQSMSKFYLDTDLSIVRFGNVIGSNGSAIPLFNEQIQNGGPVTVTHPDVTRYFMTIPDAIKLIIQVIHFSKDYKKGAIFFLDMGKPYKIYGIVQKMIKLYGLKEKNKENPLGDIEVKFIGLQKGEKMHEELTINKKFIKTKNEDIYLCDEAFIDLDNLNKIYIELKEAINNNSAKRIVEIMKTNIDGFKHD